MREKVIAVIPAFNEERDVARVVQKTLNEVDNVIVVDDGSRDATFKLASLDGTVPVIKHSYNIGVGRALRTGFNWTHSLKPEIVIMLDADGQHDPVDISNLVEPVLKGDAVLTIGERDFGKMSSVRRASNLLTSKILHDWFNVGLYDTQCGFRAIRTDALGLMSLRQDGYPWASEMLIQARQLGLKMKSAPIETIRPSKSGIRPLRDTLQFVRMCISLKVKT